MSKISRGSLLYMFLCFFSVSMQLEGFENLRQLKEYAQATTELVEVDNSDLLRPDYTSHYRAQVPSVFQKITSRFLSWIGLKSQPVWSPKFFKSLLISLTKKREKQFLSGNFVHKIHPREGSRFFVWGDIQGAFHSWVRVLEKLRDDNIINDDLIIASPDCYFVMNGDLIDRSAYNLETLTLAMLLLDRNPDKVFYIRGNHEERDNWHDYGLLDDLEIRARDLSDEEDPLHTPINNFFATLPLALYLQSFEEGQAKLVRISHFGMDDARLDEKKMRSFLTEDEGAQVKTKDLADPQIQPDPMPISVFIKGISRSIIFQPTDGLTLLAPDRGATSWTLLSSPTPTYQELYQFYNDAFCTIEVKPLLSDWTITLNTQDSRMKDGFEAKIFNLRFGRELVGDQTGATSGQKDSIVVASTIDKSKTAETIGKSIESGLTLRVNEQNAQGGVRGAHLQLFVYDDKYTPSITVKKVKEFLALGKGNILLSPLGTSNITALLPFIKNKELLLLFPYSGAGSLRKKELTGIVHYRTSYENESRALISYALEVLKKRRFAFFYQNDAYGKSGLNAAIEELKKRHIESFVLAPYTTNTIDVGDAVEKIESFSPDVIIFFSVLAPSQELVRQLGAQSLATKHLMGISPLTESFRSHLQDKGLSCIMSHIVPDPVASTTEIARQYRAAAKKFGSSVSSDGLESYISASLFIDALEHMQPPYTNEKIISYFEQVVQRDFKGVKIHFDPQTRELSKNIWVGDGIHEPVYYDATSFSKQKQNVAPSIDSSQAHASNMFEKEDKLVIGSSLWTSEGMGLSPSIMQGMVLRTQEANKAGGIGGKHIEMVFLDDKYEPDIARKNIETLLSEYKTDVILCPNGSPTLQGYIDLVRDGKVLVAFPITGAGSFRDKDLKNMVHLRASYPDEARALTQYAIDTLGAQRIAVLYQQDLYGETGLQETRKIVSAQNIDTVLEVGYQRRVADMSLPAQKIKDFNPDAIIFYATDKAGAALIRQLGVDYLSGKKLLGYSDFSISWFQDFIRDKGLTFAVAQLMPNWQTSTLPIAQQFRKALNEQSIQKNDANQFVFESYVATDIFFDVLEKNKDSLLKEHIITSFENIKDLDYKGLNLNFISQTRELSRTMWIDPGLGEAWVKQEPITP